MKVLFAATPVAGHLNPLLAIARMVLARGDEALVATARYLAPAVTRAGARLLPLAPGADLARVEEIWPERAALHRPIGNLRGPVPPNARLAESLDFGALLPRVAAVVTDGGYGTVQLALRAGVPIVAAGRTEDKAEVGARVGWSGVGIEIPSQRPGVEDLRAAVGRVLSEPAFRARARAVAADMAALDAEAEILAVLDGSAARAASAT